MTRSKLFKKYYANPQHDYEMSETLKYKDDTGRPIDIAFVYSGRNRGKSFEISTQLLADAWYDDKQFGYIRRNDATSYDIEQYFADKYHFIMDMTDGQACGITRVKGRLKFFRLEEVDGESQRVIVKDAGYFYALSRQAAYKSLQYPEVTNLIYEEVLTDQIYLNSEPEKLMNLYSTVRRGKKDFMMWLVSNTVSVVNPYSKAWGIYLSKNKPGEIRLSKLYLGSYDSDGKEEYLLIAAHYLKDKDTLTKEDAKKKRNRIKTGIANNKWDELHLYTTCDIGFMKKYSKIMDTAVFEFDDLMFQCDILEIPDNLIDVYVNVDPDDYDDKTFSTNTMPTLYFRRKTSKIHDFTRTYTNNPNQFNPYSTKGFQKVYKIDKVIYALLERGWIIGADNLTLNDFYTAFRKFALGR